MKLLLLLFLFNYCQAQEDSLTASRFLTDSTGSTYQVEYRYQVYPVVIDTFLGATMHGIPNLHRHYWSTCSIIWYKGNRTRIVKQNIKAVYSMFDCEFDNEKLWIKRLYDK